ncbi:hypothetical protein [Oricola indica]|jgi:hypothetical protein|uniref:hypothetical protein n=1 Tax=Oricola indica TaxID=2872591 RepID=UPI001CC1174C|nr:hypothetical protein [Oricola indica]
MVGILDSISKAIREETGEIDPAAIENAKELFEVADLPLAEPVEIGRGYWPTLQVDWDPGFQIEIFADSYEFYDLRDGGFDVKEFKHKPGETIPAELVALMEKFLPKRR